MNTSYNLPMEFNSPTKIKNLVCCDLDETYIPYNQENKAKGGIKELESFLTSSADNFGLLIGWITGSNLNAVLRKSNGYISRSPHFICIHNISTILK